MPLQRQINGSVANYQRPLQRQSTAPLEAVATVNFIVEIITRNFSWLFRVLIFYI